MTMHNFALADMETEADPETEDQPPTVLTFSIGSQLFAVDVHCVREILDMTEIGALPNAPHDVLGMIDLRGQGIAIVDLAGKIGAHLQDPSAARIIVFEFSAHTGSEETTSLGIMADRVLRVQEIDAAQIEPVPDTMSGWNCDVAEGMLRSDEGIAMLLRIQDILAGSQPRGPFDFSDR
ncbi:chemotaxis protein CheW [Tropicibacter sp. R15_0]|nr:MULTISPECIES: chemotaxis protein CheW [Roseobacteraceae]MBO9465306.1 chemotaxis protein CheW [Tropicibacter sp. R15_0]